MFCSVYLALTSIRNLQCWGFIQRRCNSRWIYWRPCRKSCVLAVCICKYFSLLYFSVLTHWPLGDVAVIFKLIFQIDIMSTPCGTGLSWMPQKLIIMVMACCPLAPSHFPNQFWPRSVVPCGVTRPQWTRFFLSLLFWSVKWIMSFVCA